MRRILLVLCGALLLSACSSESDTRGSSSSSSSSSSSGAAGSGGIAGSGGAGGSGASATEGKRLWARQLIDASGSEPGLAIADDGTVDMVYATIVEGELSLVWQELGGTAELIEATTVLSPAVGRDASGIVHVVWGTGSEVRYAKRDGSTWTSETIAIDRFRPDLAVAHDGTPHVAFVDETTSNAMAYHAVPGANGWQITPVNGTDWFRESEVGIALDDGGLPMVAASNSDGDDVWFASSDGAGNWSVENLGVGAAPVGRLALARGSGGIAVAFKTVTHTLTAWRPTGGSAWAIEQASHHDSMEPPIDVAVGTNPLVTSDVDVDHPNGFGLLERIDTSWSLQPFGDHCGDAHAMALDASGEPALLISCNPSSGGLYYMTVVGRYPIDWDQQCAAAAEVMCAQACSCGVDGEQCCWGLAGSLTCTSSSACPLHAPVALCGDPTITPSQLQMCRDELPSLTCGAEGPLDLAGACASLYDPFM